MRWQDLSTEDSRGQVALLSGVLIIEDNSNLVFGEAHVYETTGFLVRTQDVESSAGRAVSQLITNSNRMCARTHNLHRR